MYILLSLVCSSHPYLFFNQDGSSMTFMGLTVDVDGNLRDFRSNDVIEPKFLETNLRAAMERNFVSFKDEYNKWKKYNCHFKIFILYNYYRGKMIQKLMRVMGINEGKYLTGKKVDGEDEIDLELIDPDSSYALTVDNLMKMLAIHMKFR